ncbi:hypothetical protein AOQ84DRAFT_209671 [Glonium stellatum]|uniref:C2H2-type domain-containing protein n=1 Tax=Glonium stellatum TaxID=574774 RepID=A0A8E2F5Y3_9PEZI|nr:hypothetical protein AOQ84DRAFT_209671 [Glonium stellatum]
MNNSHQPLLTLINLSVNQPYSETPPIHYYSREGLISQRPQSMGLNLPGDLLNSPPKSPYNRMSTGSNENLPVPAQLTSFIDDNFFQTEFEDQNAQSNPHGVLSNSPSTYPYNHAPTSFDDNIPISAQSAGFIDDHFFRTEIDDQNVHSNPRGVLPNSPPTYPYNHAPASFDDNLSMPSQSASFIDDNLFQNILDGQNVPSDLQEMLPNSPSKDPYNRVSTGFGDSRSTTLGLTNPTNDGFIPTKLESQSGGINSPELLFDVPSTHSCHRLLAGVDGSLHTPTKTTSTPPPIRIKISTLPEPPLIPSTGSQSPENFGSQRSRTWPVSPKQSHKHEDFADTVPSPTPTTTSNAPITIAAPPPRLKRGNTWPPASILNQSIALIYDHPNGRGKCRHCGVCFKPGRCMKGNLRKHVYRVHEGREVGTCGAEGCGKEFKSRDARLVHERTHSELNRKPPRVRKQKDMRRNSISGN